MDGFAIVCAMFFGLIGMALIGRAKRNANIPQFICAILLMGYPYAVSNDIVLVIIGTVLCGVAWFFRD